MRPNAINESELHAYVDRVLLETERQEVDNYLSEHRDEAERIRDYQAQNLALKARFTPVLDEQQSACIQCFSPFAVFDY